MSPDSKNFTDLAELIKAWGAQLGFAHTAISDVNLDQAEQRLGEWLAKNFHGEMRDNAGP